MKVCKNVFLEMPMNTLFKKNKKQNLIHIFVLQISVFAIQIFLLEILKFYVATFNFLKLLIEGYVSSCETKKEVLSLDHQRVRGAQ